MRKACCGHQAKKTEQGVEKNGKLFGGPLLPVFSQAKGAYALKDSSQDLYLCGKDGVKLCARRKVGRKSRSRQGELESCGQRRVCKGSVPLHGDARMGRAGKGGVPSSWSSGSVTVFTKLLRTCMRPWLCKKLDLSASLKDK